MFMTSCGNPDQPFSQVTFTRANHTLVTHLPLKWLPLKWLPLKWLPLKWLTVMVCAVVFIGLFGVHSTWAEEKPQELHALSNEALITSSVTLFHGAEKSFNAMERALLRNTELVEQAKKSRNNLIVPPKFPEAGKKPSLAALRNRVDQQKERVVALKRRLPLIEAEQTLLTNRHGYIETAKSAISSWINSQERMRLMALEIQWRLKDQSLRKKSAVDIPTVEATKKRFERYNTIQTLLEEKIQENRKSQEELEVILKAAKKELIGAEIQLDLLTKSFHQAGKHQSYQKELVNLSAYRLAAQYDKLTTEQEWQTGAFQLSLNRFKRLQNKSEKIKKALEELVPPEVKEINLDAVVYDLAKAESYAKQIGVHVEYLGQEIEQRESLVELMEKMVEQGKQLAVKNTAISDHTFRLRLLADTLQDKEQQAVDVGQLDENTQKTTSLASKALAVVESARQSLPKLQEQLGHSRATLKASLEKRQSLNKALGHARQRKEQNEIFKELAVKELLAKVESASKALTEHWKTLDQERKKNQEIKEKVTGIEFKLHSATDPLFNITQQQELSRHGEIRKQLYSLASIKLPPAEKESPSNVAVDPMQLLEKWGDTPDQPLNGIVGELETYQNTLSSRIRFIDGRQQQQTALLQNLNLEKQTLTKSIEALNAALLSAQQSFAGATEIQKRLGRYQIEPDLVPDNLSQLMNHDRIDQLQKELAEQTERQVLVGKKLEEFEKSKQVRGELPKQLSNLLAIIGSKLRIIQDREKLLKRFTASSSDWSDIDKKNLEQEAIRLFAESETWPEYFLGFFASERGTSLTEILHGYYQEVIKLEKKLSNLAEQKKAMDRLLHLSEKENPIVTGIVPSLSLRVEALVKEHARREAMIRMQLLPKQADEILKKLIKSGGQTLSVPAHLEEKDKQKVVDQAVEALFETEVKQRAAEKWITLFENRASRFGINSEMGIYQSENGSIDALHKSYQRQVFQYIGYPSAGIKQIQDVEGGVLGAKEIQQLQLGKVGLIRADRLKVQQKAAIWAAGKLLAIYLVAFFLIRMLELFLWRPLEKKAERAIPNLVRGMVAFIIYLIAFFMIVAFVFGQTLTGLLATSGVIAMVIGMAVQMNISNIFSGLAINLERPFNVGDWVNINGVKGKVADINWRATRLYDANWDYYHTIPNHTVAGAHIINYHQPSDLYWAGHVLHLSPDLDPEVMVPMLTTALARVQGKVGDPWVMYFGLDDWSATYWVYVQHHNFGKKNAFAAKVSSEVWKELNANGIKPALRLIET